MHSEEYVRGLKEALKNLVKINQSIFDSIIPIVMHGELKDWNTSVPIGEVHQFDFELFKNIDDPNVQLLVNLLENVDDIFQSIKKGKKKKMNKVIFQ